MHECLVLTSQRGSVKCHTPSPSPTPGRLPANHAARTVSAAADDIVMTLMSSVLIHACAPYLSILASQYAPCVSIGLRYLTPASLQHCKMQCQIYTILLFYALRKNAMILVVFEDASRMFGLKSKRLTAKWHILSNTCNIAIG